MTPRQWLGYHLEWIAARVLTFAQWMLTLAERLQERAL